MAAVRSGAHPLYNRAMTNAHRLAIVAALGSAVALGAQGPTLPPTPITFGFFTARFAPGGAFTLEGDGWPTFTGTWALEASEVRLATPGVRNCEGPGRYRVRNDEGRVQLALVSDDCQPRRMILDKSDWRPVGTAVTIAERSITRRAAPKLPPLPAAAPAGRQLAVVSRPRRRRRRRRAAPPRRMGRQERQEHPVARSRFPDSATRARSSGAIASSSRAPSAAAAGDSFKPGLYGDGDASDDRSPHKWMVSAFDKRTGKLLWDRVAFEGAPVDTRHIKSTYASATPVTDGRLVIAWFGSQGVYAYDVNGNFRWKVDLGHMHLGAYDIPSFEWGPASSPILWNGLAILQVDTHADSFVIALNAETGETVWKTARDELPSWGTPTVVPDAGRPRARDQRVEAAFAATTRARARNCGGSAGARRSPRRRRSSATG